LRWHSGCKTPAEDAKDPVMIRRMPPRYISFVGSIVLTGCGISLPSRGPDAGGAGGPNGSGAGGQAGAAGRGGVGGLSAGTGAGGAGGDGAGSGGIAGGGIGGGGPGGSAGTSVGPGGAGGAGASGRGGAGGQAGSTAVGGQGGGRKCPPADMLIILKVSGSMNNDVNDQPCTGGCGASSKWSLLTSSLNGLIGQTQSSVDWGLKLAASATSACTLASGTEVPVAPNDASPIMTSIAAVTPGGSSPIQATMGAGVAYLQSLSDTNPKYILFAADGDPGCLPGGGSSITGEVDAVTAAAVAGFPTFVLGIGGTAALDSIALAGGVPQTGAATSSYQVNETAQLQAAIAKAVGSAANCQP
jgi:hypothetical protein